MSEAIGARREKGGERDAPRITFLVTITGLALIGSGSAFWGFLFGLAVKQKISPHRQE